MSLYLPALELARVALGDIDERDARTLRSERFHDGSADTGTAAGYDDESKGLIGSTYMFKGRALSYNFQAFAMPDIQRYLKIRSM